MGKPSKDIFPYATVPRLWPGGTVVCIASGPSLTVEDVNYVRGKADGVIVVNTSYQIAPWADCLCASDLKWWHWHKGVPSFKGLKYATSRHCARYPGVSVLRNAGRDGLDLRPDSVRHGLNTGYRAINVAVHFGAKRIILLGYDMQTGPNKEEHWHKDHPSKSRSPYSAFIKYFASIVEPLKTAGVEVINCTRRSALNYFPKMDLQEALRAKGSLSSPATVQSSNDLTGSESQLFGPRGDTHSLSVKSQMSIVASVAILLCCCSPSTVFGEVTQVVVNAVDTHTGRPSAHVSNKPLERSPLFADRNSTPAVSKVSGTRRIKATRDDPGPDAVLRTPFLSTSSTVGDDGIAAFASTVSRTTTESCRGPLHYVSAETDAFPHDSAARSLRGWRNSGEQAEPSSCQIGPSRGVGVTPSYGSGAVFNKTSTATCMATTKVVTCDLSGIATGAGAKPSDLCVVELVANTADFIYYRQPSELHSNQVKLLRHSAIVARTELPHFPKARLEDVLVERREAVAS